MAKILETASKTRSVRVLSIGSKHLPWPNEIEMVKHEKMILPVIWETLPHVHKTQEAQAYEFTLK